MLTAHDHVSSPGRFSQRLCYAVQGTNSETEKMLIIWHNLNLRYVCSGGYIDEGLRFFSSDRKRRGWILRGYCASTQKLLHSGKSTGRALSLRKWGNINGS